MQTQSSFRTVGELTTSTGVGSEIDWNLIERVIDAVPDGVVGIAALDAAWGEITNEVTLDTSVEPVHYRLLLKIHEMRGATLRLRLDKYLAGVRDVRDSISGEREGEVTGLQEEERSDEGLRHFQRRLQGVHEVELEDDGAHQSPEKQISLIRGMVKDEQDNRVTLRRTTERTTLTRGSTPNDIKRKVPFLADVPSDADTIASPPQKTPYDTSAYDLTPLRSVLHQDQNQDQYLGEQWRGLEELDGETTVDYNSEQYGPRSRGSSVSVSRDGNRAGVTGRGGNSVFGGVGPRASSTPRQDRPSRRHVGDDRNESRYEVPVTYGGPAHPSSSRPNPIGAHARRPSTTSSMGHKPTGQRFSLDSAADHQTDDLSRTTLPTPEPRIMQALHRSENLRALQREAIKMEEVYEGNIQGMEDLADTFWQEGSLMRGFGKWLRKADEAQDRDTALASKLPQMDHLRLSLLFPRWRRAQELRVQDEVIARQHHVATLQRKAFATWKASAKLERDERIADEVLDRNDDEIVTRAFRGWWGKVKQVHLERWKRELQGKEAEWVQRRERSTLSDAFQGWHRASKLSELLRDQDTALKATAFETWLGLTRSGHLLRDREQDWQNRKNVVLEVTTWNMWRKALRLKQAEQEVVARADEAAAARVLNRLAAKVLLERKSRDFNTRSLLKRSVVVWLRETEALKNLNRKAHKRVVDSEARLVTMAFGSWKLRYRGLQALRQREIDTIGMAFSIWRSRTTEVKQHEDLASSISAKKALETFRGALRQWHARLAAVRADEAKADDMLRLVAQHRCLERWTSMTEAARHREKQALNCRAFHLQRRYFKIWKANHRESLQRAFAIDLERNFRGSHFKHWLSEFRLRRDRDSLAATLEAGRMEKLSRAVFQTWWQRLLDIRLREEAVVLTDSQKLLRFAMHSWMEATKAKGDLISLAISFRDIKQKESLQMALQHWAHTAIALKRRREQWDEVVNDYNVRVKVTTLSAWRAKLKSKRLEPIANRMLVTSADALMFLAFDRWKARSRRLPAITFDRLATKNRYWAIWREAVPKAKRLRQAARVEEQKLLSDALQIWKEAYRKKVARRAAARVRGSAGLFTLKPASPPPTLPAFDLSVVATAARPAVDRKPRTSLLSFGR